MKHKTVSLFNKNMPMQASNGLGKKRSKLKTQIKMNNIISPPTPKKKK